MTDISEIIESMTRAEQTGQTDDYVKRLDLCLKLSQKLLDIPLDYADAGDGLGGLSTPDVLRTFACIIGVSLRATTQSDPISGFALLNEVVETIVKIFLAEEEL